MFQKSFFFTVLVSGFSFVLGSCSFYRSEVDWITLEFELQSQSSKMKTQAEGSLTQGSVAALEERANLSENRKNIEEFSCLALTVSGSGIRSSIKSLPSGCSKGSHAEEMGLTSSLISATGDGKISMQVLMGAQRKVRAIGIQGLKDCNASSLEALLSAKSASEIPLKEGGATLRFYSLAENTLDLFQDKEIVLKSTYDSASAKPIITCSTAVPQIAGLQITGDELSLQGLNLQGVQEVVIKSGDQELILQIEAQSSEGLIARAASALTLMIGQAYELILRTASASTSFPIMFTLPSMGAQNGDVLTYSSSAAAWRPQPQPRAPQWGIEDSSGVVRGYIMRTRNHGIDLMLPSGEILQNFNLLTGDLNEAGMMDFYFVNSCGLWKP
jgi:hypothetical protein